MKALSILRRLAPLALFLALFLMAEPPRVFAQVAEIGGGEAPAFVPPDTTGCNLRPDGDCDAPERGSIRLLEPLSETGNPRIEPEPGLGNFFTYFNTAWPYILGVVAGVAVLQVLVAGIQILTSAGGEGLASGKTRLQWAIAGLILLALAGFILRTLNPTFYF